MRRRTPQEEKQLSMEKDRRNVYGESPHGSRKIIPLRKQLRNRANRHHAESQLPAGPVQLDSDDADEIKAAIMSKAPVAWEKVPDASLGQVIAHKKKRRAVAGVRLRSVGLGSFELKDHTFFN